MTSQLVPSADPASLTPRPSAVRAPGATYRLQFNRGFTFRDARRLVAYLARLGITDCYASPYLKARPESTHGYDIADHNALNPAIGTDADYAAFAATLQEHGMGQLLDVVPNHMGIGTGANTWWMDVLENGPSSIYALFFDIDWQPIKPDLTGKVLLPILGDQYGRVLEHGELQLDYWDGVFFLRYYEHILPVAPRTYANVLEGPCARLAERWPEDDETLLELESIITSIHHLPRRDETEPRLVRERNREKEVVKRRLARLTQNETVRREIEAEIVRINGRKGVPRSFDALDAILGDQAYRLSYWRVAAEEINYRRFFDINDLAAIRMENPIVFRETHRLIFRLLGEGKVTGLRIDHPDGLWDPAQYFRRLQAAYAVVRRGVPWDEVDFDTPGGVADGASAAPIGTRSIQPGQERLYVAVEKILAKDEPLPEDWPVDGTTGYDFMAAVGGIFVDGANRKAFDDLYGRFIGQRIDFHELVYESKRTIMRVSLASEINVLATQLSRLAARDRRSRDFTLNALRDALREVIACFPVYRTYITGRPVPERDRAHIELAVAWARRRNPAVETTVFRFLRDTLLLEGSGVRGQESGDGHGGDPTDGSFTGADWGGEERPPDPRSPTLDLHDERLRFVMKFQQATGPVTAKAVEDTAFYRYNRLVALNEVGGEPDSFGVSVAAFHRMNAERLRSWPHTLLSTSTHDTKRSEDVRARIAVLSEIPREWSGAITRWTRQNRRRKRSVDGHLAPSRNDEYLLYQVLLGAWPFEGDGSQVMGNREQAAIPHPPSPIPRHPSPEFVGRIQEYMAKATKEAKVSTSWINPNEAYDEAVREFIRAILAPGDSAPFLEDFRAFQRRIVPFGAINSLAQALLKLTVPGVPDVYQGNELWDLSLVDPDNRRPVDYDLRVRLLDELSDQVERAVNGAVDGVGAEALLRSPAQPGASEGWGHALPLQMLARGLADSYADGRIKLYVTWRALTYRRDHAALFRAGSYTPLEAAGRRGEHVCAFAREFDRERVVVVVPRLLARLAPGLHSTLAIPPEVWSDSRLLLADGASGGRYRNLFTGEIVQADGSRGAEGSVLLGDLFAAFPVALLHRETP